MQQQQSLQDDLQTVQVYSFEPSGPNFNSLEYLKRAFFAVDDFQMSAPEASVHWSIFKMAVANFSGTAQFPANCLKEYCRLKLDGMVSMLLAWLIPGISTCAEGDWDGTALEIGLTLLKSSQRASNGFNAVVQSKLDSFIGLPFSPPSGGAQHTYTNPSHPPSSPWPCIL